MSTSESKANYSAETVKSEVRQTLRQLSELTRSDASFDEFCETVLNKVVQLTGAHGALLWQLNGNGQPGVTHKAVGLNAANIAPNVLQHGAVVQEVITTENPIAVSSNRLPPVAEPESESGDHPVETQVYLMLFSPIYNRKKICCGSIELLQRKEISQSAQEGYLKFLSQIAQLFPRWHEQHDLAKLSVSADKFSEKMEFVTEVHRNIKFKEAAFTIANEARRLLSCDRVSVGDWNGSRCKIVAISSQDRFDNRANVVRKLGNVATSSISSDTSFWITGDTENIAPEVAAQINEYLDESHCRTFAVLPLVKRPDDTTDLEMDKSLKEKPKKLGVILFEFFDREVSEDVLRDDCDLIVEQSTLALNNARQHSEIFLFPVWQRLGWMQKLLFRDHRATTITVLSCMAIFMAFLLFFPAQLKMKVDGVMHPQDQQNIFSLTDGKISTVHIMDQAQVKQGQELLKLENKTLMIDIEDTKLQLKIANEQITALQFQLNRDEGNRPESDTLALIAKRQQFQSQKTGLEEKLKLLELKDQELIIKSPIDGRIVTWEINERLKGLPVSFGQPIMAVADFEGPWQLEVKIPQSDIGYVQSAMNANDGESLDVDFVIGTNPNLLLKGKLVRISNRAEMSEAGYPVFRAVVEADIEQLRENGGKELRQGIGVTARIKCGYKPLGFVWFYQIYDFFRTKVFF